MNQDEVMKEALQALAGVLKAHRLDEGSPDNRMKIISAVSDAEKSITNLSRAIEQSKNKTKFSVLAITTAYEQGVGKGHQAQNRCVNIVNPYIAGDCFDAWELGYREGKGQAARALQSVEAMKQTNQQEPEVWLRQAIKWLEKADQEAGFKLWWGEFMPAAFRDRAWEAWCMAHPAPEQPHTDHTCPACNTAAQPQPCTWTEDADGYYSTGCGEAYVFNDGTPAQNNAYFCHHCGGRIVNGEAAAEELAVTRDAQAA